MSDKMWYLDRFVDKMEKVFGFRSDEHNRSTCVREYWRENDDGSVNLDPDKLKTELVGYEIEIKRQKGEKVGMGTAGHLKVKRIPTTHKVIGRGEVIAREL